MNNRSDHFESGTEAKWKAFAPMLSSLSGGGKPRETLTCCVRVPAVLMPILCLSAASLGRVSTDAMGVTWWNNVARECKRLSKSPVQGHRTGFDEHMLQYLVNLTLSCGLSVVYVLEILTRYKDLKTCWVWNWIRDRVGIKLAFVESAQCFVIVAVVHGCFRNSR